jgi:hypothetical protein
MRLVISLFALAGLVFAATQAEAASCSSFAVIKSYDADAKTVEVEYKKGRTSKYFPKPEGTPRDSSKIPRSCKGKVTKTTTLAVKPTGGRMTVTQVRSNFEGKMQNDTDDPAWLAGKLQELIEAKAEVVIVVRPGVGKDAPLGMTTLYRPRSKRSMTTRRTPDRVPIGVYTTWGTSGPSSTRRAATRRRTLE